MKYRVYTFFVLAFAVVGIFAHSTNASAVEDPNASPGSGEYKYGIRVYLNTPETAITPTARIKYTTNGLTPGCASTRPGTIFTDRIHLIENTTIKAITCINPTTGSNVVDFTYTFISGGTGGAGNSSGDSTETPGAPECDMQVYPELCPPSAPDAGDVAPSLNAPVFGSVIASARSIFNRDLNFGKQGPDVARLQQFLVAQNTGPAARALSGPGDTGYFGEMTRKALTEFQTRLKISPTAGYLGPLTIGRINAIQGWTPSFEYRATANQ